MRKWLIGVGSCVVLAFLVWMALDTQETAPSDSAPPEATVERRAEGVVETRSRPLLPQKRSPKTVPRKGGAVDLALEHGLVTASCVLDDEVGNGGGTFLGEGNWQVYTEGNTVWFLEAYGVGTLYLPGRAPIELDLSAPDCGGTVAVEPAAATVVGQVTRLGEPEPDAVVRVCDLRVRVDAEGYYTATARPDEVCEVWAERRDGTVLTRSDAVELSPRRGENVLDFDLPGAQGAIDLTLDPRDDGLFILTSGHPEVWAGDEVIGVNGLDTSQMGPFEVVQEFIGDEGTEVELELVDDQGESRTVVLTRTAID